MIAGPSKFVPRFCNSVVIAFGSTFLAVFLGTLAAYGFSRFRVPLKDDLLFFILSTRMMPPIAVAIPIYLMYRELGLLRHEARHDPALHGGQRIARRLAAQGLHRRDPARVRGGRDDRRLHAPAGLLKVVLPQAATGIAATAIFCLIFAWNEYAFAVLLTSGEAQTAPPFIPIIIGEGGQDWPAVAAGTTLFLVPILVFTVLLRKHLLRGITFGAVRK